MRFTVGITALAGMMLVIALVAFEGFAVVMQVLASVRWGILVVALIHLCSMLVCALAWGELMPATWRHPLPGLFVLRWIREGVNSLLPVAQVGGVFVQARLLTFRGVAADRAGASIVVDLTMEVMTLFVFSLAGLGLLVASSRAKSTASLALGLAVGFPAIIGFVAAQRFGMIGLLVRLAERLARRSGWRSPGAMMALDDEIQALYGNRRGLASAAALHFVSWLMSAAEIWVLLRFMALPAGPREAVIIASLGYAVRAAGFLVPGAFGVQEGGFMLLGTLVGVPAHLGLALSLAPRIREILLGLPALLTWQLLEGRRLWRTRGQVG